jgi:PAS domain S-box-containing protein
VFDVTQANATARALRESENRLRTIIEEMPVVLDAMDENGTIVFWNREAERVTGYGRDEVIGSPGFFTTAYPDPAYREAMVAEWQRRGNAYRDWEWTMTCKDGAQRVIAWSNVSGRTPIPGWAAWGVGIDVTRRREAEARMETLSRRLLAVQEDERRAVSLELHDDIGQALTAIKLNLEGLQRQPEAARAAALADSVALVEEAIRSVRTLAYALRPQILDDLGLAAALGWLVERTRERTGLAVSCDLALPPDCDPDATLSAACFRIAQEGLTNVVRHSGATQVHVSLTADERSLVLCIEDDGQGFDLEAAQARARRGDGLGVPGMEERARLAGGRLEIHATAGSGTRVCAAFPRITGGA